MLYNAKKADAATGSNDEEEKRNERKEGKKREKIKEEMNDVEKIMGWNEK